MTLQPLRTFLFTLAAVLFTGTVAELLLVGHTDGPIQLIPFGLCALGLLCLTVAWLRPSRATLLARRLLTLVIAAGSLLGVAEHFLGNRGFAQDTHPDIGTVELFREALSGGVPLLAPGILAVAAAVTFAAALTIDSQVPGTTASEAVQQPADPRPAAGDRAFQNAGSGRWAARPL